MTASSRSAPPDGRLRRRRRPLEEDGKIATLLLGLYEDDGELRYVGSAAVPAKNEAEIHARIEPLLRDAPDRRFSEPSRWGNPGLEEAAVSGVVVEIRFDKLERHRFRHGTRLLRSREDKDPPQCTWREVLPLLRKGDPTVADLLGGS